MTEHSISEIYELYVRVDHIETSDLIRAAKHFEEIQWRANAAGPVFALAGREAGRVASGMRGYIAARVVTRAAAKAGG